MAEEDAMNVTEQSDVEAAESREDAMSAKEIIADILESYGLGNLVDQAWEMLIEMDSPDANTVALQLRRSEEFQERFKGMQLRSENGHAGISPMISYDKPTMTFGKIWKAVPGKLKISFHSLPSISCDPNVKFTR